MNNTIDIVIEQLNNKCLKMEWRYELDKGNIISMSSCSPPIITLKYGAFYTPCLFLGDKLIEASKGQESKIKEIMIKLEQHYIQSLLHATIVKLTGMGD